ncbi:ribosomal protection tetracycline resistance protein [Nocardiopsis sp. Huas11]|uniref:elongation factor G n=1 Tax=Nocardiopsis sp. Huas11 TaxID=2183912 RepID=UPI000EB02C8C|nr:TetM/TetW/TetO/TetS family tetracycline resistance ribosomal protection protein [Nocardiopsis sp. Huas11]RKS05633.1 ribosomal protection tetracycline resistance protein [Nocardiopsis sp. Huas11]
MTSTLNIGVLAHVDAGKTSLTERLLFEAGAIHRLGSVDAGDTTTDTGDIERERGITIRTAVAGFRVGRTRVNLIDTPGHTDFVAEVERALAVLDGAVLVVSAVEGVQAHTRVLMRVLRESGLPVLLFVNKTDRAGARPERVTAEIRRRLTDRAMDTVRDAGTPHARTEPGRWRDPAFAGRVAEALAEHDDALLAALVEDRPPPGPGALTAALRHQVGCGLVYPVLCGSAVTGDGVGALSRALTALLPVTTASPDEGGGQEPRGTVFAIERAPSGEKTGYLRLRAGCLAPRAHVEFERADPADGGPHRGRIIGLEVVGAEDERSRPLVAGEIGRIRGLPGLRVGDRMGPPAAVAGFARPALEAVVRPRDGGDATRLHAALTALADQDPLIRLRTVPEEGLSVLLYGEVQKEVIAATLADDFGVRAVFERSRTTHTERPAGTGSAVEEISPRRPVGAWATVGLRVDPAGEGTGVVFRRVVEYGALIGAFDRAIEETVRETLRQGLYGWPVTDCAVTLIRSGFLPPTTPADFRELTPLVLMRALDRAGTRVFEPVHGFELEVPADVLGPVTARLNGLGARVRETVETVEGWRLTGEVAARSVDDFRAELPGLSRGEGVWWTSPARECPVRGPVPRRARTDGNPLDYEEYLVHRANARRRG